MLAGSSASPTSPSRRLPAQSGSSRLVADGRNAGLLVILDAKRGDVGSTNEAYAEAFLGTRAPFAADAVTVHPYLGLGAMQPFVERADGSGSCLLVVARSTNPDGRTIQSAVAGSGRRVEQVLLDEIAELNARLAPGRVGPVGAVVGPTHGSHASGGPPDLELPPNALFLAPGLGAQGSSVADIARVFAACPDRVMPSASRSLLEHGPDRQRLHDAVAALAGEVREALASR